MASTYLLDVVEAAHWHANHTDCSRPTRVYTSGPVGFGAGALVGGLLTAAIPWDKDDWHRSDYGGLGHYGNPGYWNHASYRSSSWHSPADIRIGEPRRGPLSRGKDVQKQSERGERASAAHRAEAAEVAVSVPATAATTDGANLLAPSRQSWRLLR